MIGRLASLHHLFLIIGAISIILTSVYYHQLQSSMFNSAMADFTVKGDILAQDGYMQEVTNSSTYTAHHDGCPYRWSGLDFISTNSSFKYLNSNTFVYSAFFDDRDRNNLLVKVVAVVDKVTTAKPPHCILWFGDNTCQIVRATVERVCGAGPFM